MIQQKQYEKDMDHEKTIKKLKELSRHSEVRIVNCGNAAIFAALCIARTVNARPCILIPDQGGWISFQTYTKILGFEVREIRTDKGVIDLKHLEKEAPSGAAFLVTSFAGYYAEQPMKRIAEICKKHGCLLIEDASGAIGDPILCNGAVSDIIIGSFGRWKPVNCGEGGFISASDSGYFEKTKEAYSMFRSKPDYAKLLKKLGQAEERLGFFFRTAEKIKKDLKDLNVFHAGRRGLNVVVGFEDSVQKKKISDYCKDRGYPFVVCPKYIRVMQDAISIEVKRLLSNGEDEESGQAGEE